MRPRVESDSMSGDPSGLIDQRDPGIFDAHFHVIDPNHPIRANDGFLPDPFTVDDYLERTAGLNVTGGAVVSGSFQGFDQGYLVDALEKLGNSFVGVTQVPAEIADGEILELDRAGVRAVRFNLRRGGSAELADMVRLARRVYYLAGWHSELYVEGRDLKGLFDRIAALPVACVDHFGLEREGFGDLLRLVESGVKVKASGFGRIDMDPSVAIREIANVDPTALMFGTDLPSTRADRPFRGSDLELFGEVLGSADLEAVLRDNAEALYLKRPRVDAFNHDC